MAFDHDALPLRLFTASHERAWNPAAIDFSHERAGWLALSDDERRLLLRLVASFRIGERGVAHELTPLHARFRRDGWLEEEVFVAAQMYEEARHVQFFERWLVEALPGRFGVDIPYPRLHGDMFSVQLPRAMGALIEDDRPEALLRAVMLYHFYVEGVGAEAGYALYFAAFEHSRQFPGLERGIRLIQRDEARHIAFGVHVLQRLLAAHPRLIEPFEEQAAGMRRLADDDLDQLLSDFEPGTAPFGIDHETCRRHYRNRVEEMRRRVRGEPAAAPAGA